VSEQRLAADHLDGEAVAVLERNLGYVFKDRELVTQALMHRSFAGEYQLETSYERLEFLGDAVLQLSVTCFLFNQRPDLSEGEMAKVRAAVVNQSALARLAREWGVGAALLLGRGEILTGGQEKSSMLSDVVEALVGAVYVEAGFEVADALVIGHWRDLIEERAAAPGRRDYKTRLQEMLARRGVRPEYMVEERGPEHAKQFTAWVKVGDDVLGTGAGTSKKRAEQAAAEAAAVALEPTPDDHLTL
jgi:ribonuclease-3